MYKLNKAHGKIITIIGGNGAMGQLFKKYWQETGAVVHTIDQNDWDNAPEILNKSDLAIICVPIHETYSAIDSTSKFINPNTILADFTSIKEPVINHMQKMHKGPVLGLHPMFGPTIDSPKSQVIINCKGAWLDESKWVIDSLQQLGFTLLELSANKHDNLMSFIQGIEHFSTFTLGSFLKQQDVHPQQLIGIASPIYKIKLSLLGRIFDQDAALYADIIMSDTNRIKLIEAYTKHLQDWLTKLKLGSREEFITEFENISNWMGDFTSQSQLSSDNFLNQIIDHT